MLCKVRKLRENEPKTITNTIFDYFGRWKSHRMPDVHSKLTFLRM